MLPLFFQVVLLDSASQAGGRLAIPSLATPIGGLIAGFVMSRYGRLIGLIRLGAFCMVVGNSLVTALKFYDSTWKYYVYIFPANLGQGILYPSTLFTNIATFEHSGKYNSTHLCGEEQADMCADHAVSASTVYLIRSMGTVWGVAVTAAIVQTVLKNQLPSALGDIAHKQEVCRFLIPSAFADANIFITVYRTDPTLGNRLERLAILGPACGEDGLLRWHSLCFRGIYCVCSHFARGRLLR